MILDRPDDPWFVRRHLAVGSVLMGWLVIVGTAAASNWMADGVPAVTITTSGGVLTLVLGAYMKFANDDDKDKRNGHGS